MRQARVHVRLLQRLTPALILASVTGCASVPPDKRPTIGDATIVVGVGDAAPGFSHGSRNPAGFDIDLMNAIGKALGVPVVPTIVTAKDRPGYLKDKKATIIISTYSITPARNDDGIDFAGPYMVSPQALLIRVDDQRFGHAGDIAGKAVCTVESTTGGQVDIPGANMSNSRPTSSDCITLLDQDRTDAVFDDEIILHGFAQANPGRFRVIHSGDFGNLQYYGVGLLGRRHADCEKLNGVIREYLRTSWRHDFKDTLQNAADAYPATSSTSDFESYFKPKESDITTLSCKLK
jgi:glutamate transport system substrate-binding protein